MKFNCKMKKSTNIVILMITMVILAVCIIVYARASKYQKYDKISASVTKAKDVVSSVSTEKKGSSSKKNKTGKRTTLYYAHIDQNLTVKYEYKGKEYEKEINNRTLHGTKHYSKLDAKQDLQSKNVKGYCKVGDVLDIYTNGEDLAEAAKIDSDSGTKWGIVVVSVFIVGSAIYQILCHTKGGNNGKKKKSKKQNSDNKDLI